MSWHSEDWAKLGSGFADWFKAHPTTVWMMAAAFAGFVLGAIIF